MKATERIGLRTAVLAGLALALAVGVWAQSSGSTGSTTSTSLQTAPAAQPEPTAQPTPGTTPAASLRTPAGAGRTTPTAGRPVPAEMFPGAVRPG